MSNFVRRSKFRHVYGQPSRKENCLENIPLTRNAHDGNVCAVNPKYIAIATDSGGGGSFIVLPTGKTGRVDINSPRVCGHDGSVLELKWSPFHDDIIASGSDDCTVKVWNIPDGGLTSNLKQCEISLCGHSKKVMYLEWHPIADNIMLSTSQDCQCILWNVEQAEPVTVMDCHHEMIYSLSWNRDGTAFCTTSRDKKLRVIDPRADQYLVAEATVMNSAMKPIKSVFLGDSGRILTTHFGRSSERFCSIWDLQLDGPNLKLEESSSESLDKWKNMSKPLNSVNIDSACGTLMPFYDFDTKMVYLAGKGDANIRYFEITDNEPYVHYLSSFGSPSPQRALGVMPKRGCDITKCEVMRFYKLHSSKNFVEPISMIVPRKSDTFQEDIYPPTNSSVPSLSADEWVSGQNREPILISMKDGSVCNCPKVTAAHSAVPVKDGVVNQVPTITTYKSVNKSSSSAPPQSSKVAMVADSGGAPSVGKQKTPASLQNIKRLSTNEDFVTITPSPALVQAPAPPPAAAPPSAPATASDKAFVNDKIAAFERQNSSSDTVVSPSRRRSDRKSWSTTSTEPPPDVIANGLKGSEKEHKGTETKGVSSPKQFFDHKEIEIVSVEKERKIPPSETNGFHRDQKSSDSGKNLSQTKRGSLILGNITEDKKDTTTNTTVVKKVWSPVQPSSDKLPWQNMPQTDPELRKAYFRQAEEIKSLKEQIALKDKRIRQLEDEMNILRTGSREHGESDC